MQMNSRYVPKFVGRSLEWYSISFFQDIKSGVSNPNLSVKVSSVLTFVGLNFYRL